MHTKNDRITPGVRRRRDHSPELKRDLVARSLIPGASVSAIALEVGINANLLFTWRRAHVEALRLVGQQATPAPAVLLPVTIEVPKHEAISAPSPSTPRASTGSIEIEMGSARMRVRGVVDEVSLRNVVRVLRELA